MNQYEMTLVAFSCVYAILALSLDVLIGDIGLFSSAHAVFFAVGAYAAALANEHLSDSILVGMGLGLGAAAGLGCLFALTTVRSREVTFIVSSLALGIVCLQVLSDWTSFTGGENGLSVVHPAQLFGMALGRYGLMVLAIATLVIVALVRWAISRGPFGLRLKAIRDEESAAAAYGTRVMRVKLEAVVITSMLASLGGVIYAYYVIYISPESFTNDQSILIAAMVVIGGMGRVIGPVIGAVALTALPSLLALLPLPATDLGPINQIIYGGALVLVMLVEPGGITGLVLRGYHRLAPGSRLRGEPQRQMPAGHGALAERPAKEILSVATVGSEEGPRGR